jgi:sec-independent protein translocase protein TatA
MRPLVAVDMDPLVWVIIFAIIVLLFGGSRIPGLGKSIGQSIRGFKSGLSGEDEEKAKQLESKPPDDTAPPTPPPAPPTA